MGGKFHLKLNIGERPIANKYREGKMKRTLKRELKVLEIAEREPIVKQCVRCSADYLCFDSSVLSVELRCQCRIICQWEVAAVRSV